MTLSKCWKYLINDHYNPDATFKAMHRLDCTMAACLDVEVISYGLHHLGGCLAIHGYILFLDDKDKTMVNELLPDFDLQYIDYINYIAQFCEFLHKYCVFVKLGMGSWQEENNLITFDVYWHYINPATNGCFQLTEL